MTSNDPGQDPPIEDDDTVVIICNRVDSVDVQVLASTNSERANCDKCNAQVWVAESSRNFLARTPQARILCGPCAFADVTDHIAENPDEELHMSAVPGAREEFRKYIENVLKAEQN